MSQTPPELSYEQRLFLETPFYETVPLGPQEWFECLKKVLRYPDSLDTYCTQCERDVTFTPMYYDRNHADPSQDYEGKEVIRTVTFRCPRDQRHLLHFTLLVVHDDKRVVDENRKGRTIHNRSVTKIGQWPSRAALEKGHVKQYRNLLGDMAEEYTRALGLYSHGIGIGSFVYLRRIFERLVEEAHQKATGDAGWDESLYERSRMSERIGLLKHVLPTFLVDNKNLYGILSKGIHELSEGECNRYFDAVNWGIRLIMDEEIESRQKAERLDRVQKELAEISEKLAPRHDGE